MARGLRPGNRQFARGARLDVFARWRGVDRGGADRSGGPPLGASVSAGGVPRPFEAGPGRSRNCSDPGPAGGNEAARRARRLDPGGCRDGRRVHQDTRHGQAPGRRRVPAARPQGVVFLHNASGRFRMAQPFAQEFHALTLRGSDRNDLMFAERMMGVAAHYVGDQMTARRHLEQALAQEAVSDHGRDVVRFQDVLRFGTDLRVSTRVFLAKVLWLQGFADQAVRMAERSLGEAEATGHAISQCYVLASISCLIAFWVGDHVSAARYTGKLVDLSRQNTLPFWAAFGAR